MCTSAAAEAAVVAAAGGIAEDAVTACRWKLRMVSASRVVSGLAVPVKLLMLMLALYMPAVAGRLAQLLMVLRLAARMKLLVLMLALCMPAAAAGRHSCLTASRA